MFVSSHFEVAKQVWPESDGGSRGLRSSALRQIATELKARALERNLKNAALRLEASVCSDVAQRSKMRKLVQRKRFSHSDALRRYAASKADNADSSVKTWTTSVLLIAVQRTTLRLSNAFH